MYDKKIQCEFDCLFRQTALQAFKLTFMRYRFLNMKKKIKFFYQFQFRELFIFSFMEMIKSQCFYRFFLTQKN